MTKSRRCIGFERPPSKANGYGVARERSDIRVGTEVERAVQELYRDVDDLISQPSRYLYLFLVALPIMTIVWWVIRKFFGDAPMFKSEPSTRE